MKSKIISNQLSEKKKSSRFKKRRALAEIISTMLLMGVTISGATTLTYFVNDGFISGNLEAASAFDSSKNIILLAYDTRDSSSLLTLIDVDNDIDFVTDIDGNPILCGFTCSVTPNDIPANGGTEFIVLQIQNNGIDLVFLEDIAINNVIHSWDSSTAGIQLDTTAPLVNGKYPVDGMFSILLMGTPIIQNDSIKIQSGQTVNLLVKLGSNDSDILLNKGIHVRLDVGGIHSKAFLLESGDAR